MSASVILLLVITAQRLVELVIARRNTQRLLARGAVEIGAGHYPLIVALHTAWIVALWALGAGREIVGGFVAVYAALQLFRVWILGSLGSRWTTRIILLPGEPLVRRGPYRFMSHPNYALVVAEIAVVPLALGLVWVAIVFSVLNAVVLAIRIRAEASGLKSVEAGM